MSAFSDYIIRMKEYVDEDSLQKFARFLETNSLLVSFTSNIIIRDNMTIDSPELLVANAFGWTKSPEGYQYWELIESKWLNYLNT